MDETCNEQQYNWGQMYITLKQLGILLSSSEVDADSIEDLAREFGLTESLDSKLDQLCLVVDNLLEVCSVPKGEEWRVSAVSEQIEGLMV